MREELPNNSSIRGRWEPYLSKRLSLNWSRMLSLSIIIMFICSVYTASLGSSFTKLVAVEIKRLLQGNDSLYVLMIKM